MSKLSDSQMRILHSTSKSRSCPRGFTSQNFPHPTATQLPQSWLSIGDRAHDVLSWGGILIEADERSLFCWCVTLIRGCFHSYSYLRTAPWEPGSPLAGCGVPTHRAPHQLNQSSLFLYQLEYIVKHQPSPSYPFAFAPT